MTKAELVDVISWETGVRKKDTGMIVNLILENISNSLVRGDKVELRGFGSFKVKTRRARAARNPRTGAAVQVLAISDVPGDNLAIIGSGLGSAPVRVDFTYRSQIIASNKIAREAAVQMAKTLDIKVLADEEALHDDLEVLAKDIGKRKIGRAHV